MKKCSKCKENKRLGEYYKNCGTKDRLRYKCKACVGLHNIEHNRTIEGFISKVYGAQRSHSKKRGHLLPTYSKGELKKWILEQHNFQTLWDNWVALGYLTDLIPSVDRKDDYKSYTLDNIQLVTFKENREKSCEDAINGINRKTLIEVCMFDYTTNKLLKKYYSYSEAYRQTLINISNIRCIINKGQKSAKVNAGEFKGIIVYFKKDKPNERLRKSSGND